MESVLASTVAYAVEWYELCFGFRLKMAASLATAGILMNTISGNRQRTLAYAVILLGVYCAVGISRVATTLLGEVML